MLQASQTNASQSISSGVRHLVGTLEVAKITEVEGVIEGQEKDQHPNVYVERVKARITYSGIVLSVSARRVETGDTMVGVKVVLTFRDD